VNKVIVGRVPYVGCAGNYVLSQELLTQLKSMNIHSLAHISSKFVFVRSDSVDWLSSNELDLSGDLMTEWDIFILNLRKNGLSLSETRDRLVWSWNNMTGEVQAKLAYDSLVYKDCKISLNLWSLEIWKIKVPMKISLFIWIAISNRILTGDNYQKRGGIGPSICPLCMKNDETVCHMLIYCTVFQSIWEEVLMLLKFPGTWMETLLKRIYFNGSCYTLIIKQSPFYTMEDMVLHEAYFISEH